LFDSGARAQEYLSLRMRDISYVDNYYKVRITVSKTKPRTISMPLYPEIIREYLSKHPNKDNLDAPLCIYSYNSAKTILKRLGAKILNRNVFFHLLRHSSATYYANHLSHYNICYRYGWSMSSDMPNRYIDYAGIVEKETANIVMNHESEKHIKEQSTLKSELDLMRLTIKELQEQDSKRKLEQDLHNTLMQKASSFDNKEGIKDFKEILFQVLKQDKELLGRLKELIM